MTHIFRWRRTSWGPLHPDLARRFGHRCRIFCRGLNGSLGIEFEDGARFVVMRFAVRRARSVSGSL